MGGVHVLAAVVGVAVAAGIVRHLWVMSQLRELRTAQQSDHEQIEAHRMTIVALGELLGGGERVRQLVRETMAEQRTGKRRRLGLVRAAPLILIFMAAAAAGALVVLDPGSGGDDEQVAGSTTTTMPASGRPPEGSTTIPGELDRPTSSPGPSSATETAPAPATSANPPPAEDAGSQESGGGGPVVDPPEGGDGPPPPPPASQEPPSSVTPPGETPPPDVPDPPPPAGGDGAAPVDVGLDVELLGIEIADVRLGPDECACPA